MAVVLVVEDEKNIANILQLHLSREGHTCHLARDGADALTQLKVIQPNLVVLDLMLPFVDGFEVARTIRQTSKVPILMLTARKDEVDRVVGLELGADDYMTKPFSIREFLARTRALLRRVAWDTSPDTANPSSIKPDLLTFGELNIDVTSHQVTLEGVPVALTQGEFALLTTLARRPGVVFSRSQLQELARGLSPLDSYDRSVDSIMARLRKKLSDDPAKPRYIATVRGIGYRFVPTMVE